MIKLINYYLNALSFILKGEKLAKPIKTKGEKNGEMVNCFSCRIAK